MQANGVNNTLFFVSAASGARLDWGNNWLEMYFNGTKINMTLPTYADNTAAASLPSGQLYKTSTGEVRIKY
jgi:hypothetical protein